MTTARATKHALPIGLRRPRQPPRSESEHRQKAAWREQHCPSCCNHACGTKAQCRGTTRTNIRLAACPRCGHVW